MTTLKRRPLAGTPEGWNPYEIPPIMQEVFAARGILHPEGIEQRLAKLISPTLLGSIDRAAEILADAILSDKAIRVAGDYDCDGATGSAVAVRGLRILGAKNVSFIVPNRFKHGYGLSPGLVDDMQPVPDVIVTVDSGVSSVEGVARAKQLGITVVVTDHHLPGDILPNADVIVNPNLRDDPFPSKMLAGVGVMFYTLLALRAHMRHMGVWAEGTEPDLAPLLDLVAIGTVADLVPLDKNNRILVEAGLRRIRSGNTSVGIKALIESAKRDMPNLVASDIAFSIAPRLNAAGRLEDMRLGVMTLITDDADEAKRYAEQLEAINAERREKQADMVADAEQMLLNTEVGNKVGVVVFDPEWHSGIVGLVASKLKESLYRPVIAFAPAEPGSPEVRGSARSIPGFHLRDALAIVDARNPGLIPKFGGHAMAAGLSLKTKDVEFFSEQFDQVAREILTEDLLTATIYTDGELPPGHIHLQFAYLVRQCGPWGQGFPEPIFENTFFVEDFRVMGVDGNHLKLDLVDPRDGTRVQGVFFNGFKGVEPPEYVRLAYEVSINTWQGNDSLQLMIRHLEPRD